MAQTRKRRSKKSETQEVGLVPFSGGAVGFTMDSGAWEEEVAAAISEQEASAEGIGGGWPFISTQGGTFTVPSLDREIGDELDVVIVAVGRRNLFYGTDRKFDPENRQPPVCFAIAVGNEPLMPPKDPQVRNLLEVQSEDCTSCWAAAFGTNDRGGKACSNYVRLAVLPANDEEDVSPEGLRKNAGAVLHIPPTSLKAWKKYLGVLNGTLMHSVVTTITISPDRKNQFLIELVPKYQLMRNDKDPRFSAIMERRKEAVDQIRQLPQLAVAEEAKPSRKKAVRKKAVRKKAVRKKGL